MFKKYQELQEVTGFTENNTPIKGVVKTINGIKRVLLENGKYINLSSINHLKQIGRIINEEMDKQMQKAVFDFSQFYDSIYDKEKVSKAPESVIDKIVNEYANNSKDSIIQSNKQEFSLEAKNHIKSLNSEEAIKKGQSTPDKELEKLKKDTKTKTEEFEEEIFNRVDAGNFSFKEGGFVGNNWYTTQWDLEKDLKKNLITPSRAKVICENQNWPIDWLKKYEEAFKFHLENDDGVNIDIDVDDDNHITYNDNVISEENNFDENVNDENNEAFNFDDFNIEENIEIPDDSEKSFDDLSIPDYNIDEDETDIDNFLDEIDENENKDIFDFLDEDSVINFDEDNNSEKEDSNDKIIDLLSQGYEKDDIIDIVVSEFGLSIDDANAQYDQIISDIMFDEKEYNEEDGDEEDYKEFEDKLDSFEDRFYDDNEILNSFLDSYGVDRSQISECKSLEDSIVKIAEISKKRK